MLRGSYHWTNRFLFFVFCFLLFLPELYCKWKLLGSSALKQVTRHCRRSRRTTAPAGPRSRPAAGAQSTRTGVGTTTRGFFQLLMKMRYSPFLVLKGIYTIFFWGAYANGRVALAQKSTFSLEPPAQSRFGLKVKGQQ